jgi:hypothetical protein
MRVSVTILTQLILLPWRRLRVYLWLIVTYVQSPYSPCYIYTIECLLYTIHRLMICYPSLIAFAALCLQSIQRTTFYTRQACRLTCFVWRPLSYSVKQATFRTSAVVDWCRVFDIMCHGMSCSLTEKRRLTVGIRPHEINYVVLCHGRE